MAIYHFRMKKSNRKVKGKQLRCCPMSHFLYITRQGKYEKLGGLVEFENINLEMISNLNGKNKKEIGLDFWKSSKEIERIGINKYRELEIALPKEFDMKENQKLVKEFSEHIFGKEFAYTYAIHEKNRGTPNPHVHIMFSEKYLDKVRTKENFFAHANAGGAKKDRKWQTKETLKYLRKEWEKYLNVELEKIGLEKVSCLSLKEQKRIAELNSNAEKAKLLDREVVNIEGYILYKNENELTEEELQKKKEYLLNKELKELKKEVFNSGITLGEFKKQYDLYKRWKESSDILWILDRKIELGSKIDKLSQKKEPRIVQRSVFNMMTKGDYYKYFNENKQLVRKLKKEKNLRKKALEIKLAKNNELLKNIEENILNDKKLSINFSNQVQRITQKYEKDMDKLWKELEQLDKLKEYEFSLKKDIGSINHLIYIFEKSGYKKFEDLKKYFEADYEHYSKKIRAGELDKEIIEIISVGKIGKLMEREKEIKENIKGMEKNLKGIRLLDKKLLGEIEKEKKKLDEVEYKIAQIFEDAKSEKWNDKREKKKEEYRRGIIKSEEALKNWYRLNKLFKNKSVIRNSGNLNSNLIIRDIEEIDVENER